MQTEIVTNLVPDYRTLQKVSDMAVNAAGARADRQYNECSFWLARNRLYFGTSD